MTGPLLFAFVAWILREACRRSLRTLYFFSRDGEILLRIVREFQPTLAPGLDCRYLHVSRRSLHLPGVVTLGPAEREWILDNAELAGLGDLLARLDITLAEYQQRLPLHSPLRRLDPSTRLMLHDVQEVERSLDFDAVAALILERAMQRRTDCLAYLRDQEMLALGAIGVVDIGWKGRLQRSLCRIVSTVDPGFGNRLHGFYIDLDRRPTDAGTLDVFSALCADEPFPWAARGPLFEIMCAAHHGTVTGYAPGLDGTARPLLASPDNPEADAWGLSVQQGAVVTFTREVLHGLALARVNPLEHVQKLAKAATRGVRMFISRPSRAEAEAYGSFEHCYDEKHEAAEPIAGKIDFYPLALLRRLGPAYRGRRISHWPEGSLSRSLPSGLRNPALFALHFLAACKG